MTLGLFILVAFLVLIYIPSFGMLLIYSINLYYLTAVAWLRRHRALKPPANALRPSVTVQIPLYNERYVSQRIIDAVAQLDWPRDRLHIQVLDDSTDETRQIAAESVQRWQEQGLNIEYITRPTRVGFKAGALAHGLEQTDSEYIAIFDADFVPHPDFLKQTVPLLVNDPRAAFIQARWEHLNHRASWLTRIQAISLDSHFAIEQFARSYNGHVFNFNGTAGVWRRSAIEDAGGWMAHTLTEDLDLSYRAWLRGWRGLYRRDVTSPAELPPTMMAFRRQQARWSQGSIECAVHLLPQIWRSRFSLLTKVQATLHLLGPLVTLIMVVLLLSYPVLLLVRSQIPNSVALFSFANTLSPLSLAPTLFFFAAQLFIRRPSLRTLLDVLLLQVIGMGLAMNTARATIKALIGQRTEFLRTPKWGSTELRASSYRLRADLSVIIDLLWGLVCLLIVLLALQQGHVFMVVYGMLACFGSWWVALWTMWPDIRASIATNRAQLAIDSANRL